MQNLVQGGQFHRNRSIGRTPAREEELVAELEKLGVRYINRFAQNKPVSFFPPDQLLADLVRQPTSRVRSAVVSLLLIRPDYALFIPLALRKVRGKNRLLLKIYYTAAVILRNKFQQQLQQFLGQELTVLPDLYSSELIPGIEGPPDLKLTMLGREHQIRLGEVANWRGTYENAARHLLHQLELESRWNQ
jgi:hypothetical protein